VAVIEAARLLAKLGIKPPHHPLCPVGGRGAGPAGQPRLYRSALRLASGRFAHRWRSMPRGATPIPSPPRPNTRT
jgi:hypothetical protein